MLFSFDVSLASAPQQLSRSNLNLSAGEFLFTNLDVKALKAIREVTVSRWFLIHLKRRKMILAYQHPYA